MAFLNTSTYPLVIEKHVVPGGQAGYIELIGTAYFSTTDASGTIVTGLNNVKHVTVQPATATFIANDLCGWTFSAGTLTITRVAGTTSGLKISFSIIGY